MTDERSAINYIAWERSDGRKYAIVFDLIEKLDTMASGKVTTYAVGDGTSRAHNVYLDNTQITLAAYISETPLYEYNIENTQIIADVVFAPAPLGSGSFEAYGPGQVQFRNLPQARLPTGVPFRQTEASASRGAATRVGYSAGGAGLDDIGFDNIGGKSITSRSLAVYRLLKALRTGRVAIQIVTKLDVYSDCVIKSLVTEARPEEGQAFTLELEQLKTAQLTEADDVLLRRTASRKRDQTSTDYGNRPANDATSRVTNSTLKLGSDYTGLTDASGGGGP